MRILLIATLISSAWWIGGVSSLRYKRDVEDLRGEGLFGSVRTVCFKPFGCFGSFGKYFSLTHRPFPLLPNSPDSINVSFSLFTRTQSQQDIGLNKSENLKRSEFKASRPVTYFLIHGYKSYGGKPMMKDLREALLRKEDCNVFQVDWRSGADDWYPQAVANTRLAGVILAQYIEFLIRNAPPFSLENVHIIGHSLGAHIAGYAGSELNGQVAQITGLDPAGPLFEGMDPEVRLDSSDAKFVQAIHTDGSATPNNFVFTGLGITAISGHVDIYPNGGQHQPTCSYSSYNILADLVDILKCNHDRAIQLFTESIKDAADCKFQAYPCESYEKFQKGQCFSCGGVGCASLGYNVRRWSPPSAGGPVMMFLKTQDSPPYCSVQYTLQVNGINANRVAGNLQITIVSTTGENFLTTLSSPDGYWEVRKSYILPFILRSNVRQVAKLMVSLLPTGNGGTVQELKFSSLYLGNYEQQNSTVFRSGSVGQNPTELLPVS